MKIVGTCNFSDSIARRNRDKKEISVLKITVVLVVRAIFQCAKFSREEVFLSSLFKTVFGGNEFGIVKVEVSHFKI